jgi:ParB-like chromosome segregation protein Spo0J
MGRKKPQLVSDVEPQLEHILPALRPLAIAMDSIEPDPKNLRKHEAESIRAIAKSLSDFGQVKPIVIHPETRIIIAGNGTYAAGKELGWTHIAAVIFDDAQKARAFALADNRTAELSTWDQMELTLYLRETIPLDESFADALQLADLLEKEPVVIEPDPSPKTIVFQVVVECKNERDQKRLFERMQAENRKCRLLTE